MSPMQTKDHAIRDKFTNQLLCPSVDGGWQYHPCRRSNLCMHLYRRSAKIILKRAWASGTPHLSIFKKSSSSATRRLSNTVLMPLLVLALTSYTSLSCGGTMITSSQTLGMESERERERGEERERARACLCCIESVCMCVRARLSSIGGPNIYSIFLGPFLDFSYRNPILQFSIKRRIEELHAQRERQRERASKRFLPHPTILRRHQPRPWSPLCCRRR